MLVNVLLFIVSLVDCNRENRVIAQNILTEAEVRVLLPLLENPTGCQQAVLQASYFCTSEFLLKSLLFSDANTNPQWNKLVQEQRDRLHLAQQKKAMREEMRGVYNALAGLRQKLEPFGLTVRARRDGFYLALLVKGS